MKNNAEEDTRIAKGYIKTKTSFNIYTESYDLICTASPMYYSLEAKNKAKVLTDTLPTVVQNINDSDKCTITRLIFSYLEISTENAKTIGDALKGIHKFIALEFKKCSITDKEVTVLIDGLSGNKNLTGLNLSGIHVGDKNAEAIANSLQNNLTDLDLSCSKIGVKGAEAIAAALKNNTTLTRLDLSYNELGNKGLKAIVEGLKSNTTLMDFRFDRSGFKLDAVDAEVIKELDNHPSLCLLKSNKTELYHRVVESFMHLQTLNPLHLDKQVINKTALENAMTTSFSKLCFSKPMVIEFIINKEDLNTTKKQSMLNISNKFFKLSEFWIETLLCFKHQNVLPKELVEMIGDDAITIYSDTFSDS